MNDVFVLMCGKTILDMYSSLKTAQAAAELFVPSPRRWYGNELMSIATGWETVRVDQWQVHDTIQMVGADD